MLVGLFNCVLLLVIVMVGCLRIGCACLFRVVVIGLSGGLVFLVLVFEPVSDFCCFAVGF